ncbi:hypothetical protein [Amycolatopsis aidingensis]|uniref:hypothetical protein n=1 Tax=Amycolatopsis aidingensis TaxID=2842453 RepID=UPI001C0AC3C1|nr:hypothetical protein [Amycolatopsis aidingensis]
MTLADPRPVRTPALLLDQFVPHSQFGSARHRIVNAAPDEVYAAIHELDLTRPPWPRCHRSGPEPGGSTARWVVLGERPGMELVLGAAVRLPPWSGQWLQVDPRDFREFEEPGYGKIAAGISVLPYGRRRGLLTHELRIVLADPACWPRWLRYWRLLAPLVGPAQNATLKAIEAAATALGAAPAPLA